MAGRTPTRSASGPTRRETGPPHLFDDLDPLERMVITSRFGLDGAVPRTMKELHNDLGVPRADLRDALGSGLAKLRTQLS